MSRSSARRSSGRQARRKQQNNTPLIIGGGVILVIILVAAGLALSRGSAGQIGEQISAGVPPPNLHIQNLTDPYPTYTSNPPTSGYHYIQPSGAGIYTEPIPDEITVHNLEHGFVIIHYRQDLDQATVSQLTTLARELQQQNPCIIMEPRPVDKLDQPIALTAWNWLLKLPSYDPDSIRAFFRGHVGRAPEQFCRPL